MKALRTLVVSWFLFGAVSASGFLSIIEVNVDDLKKSDWINVLAIGVLALTVGSLACFFYGFNRRDLGF